MTVKIHNIFNTCSSISLNNEHILISLFPKIIRFIIFSISSLCIEKRDSNHLHAPFTGFNSFQISNIPA